MRLMIWVGDEGPTDLDLKDGDIWGVRSDTWVPGTMELKKWLILQLPEYGGDQDELTAAEYTVGASPDSPVVRHARKYCVRYWEELTPDELAIVRDPNQSFAILNDPDRFDLWDIVRK